MRGHGRTFLAEAQRTHSHSHSQLPDLLLLSSLTKTLSESGSGYLPDPRSLPLSDSLLLRILRSNSLQPSKKLDFFQWFSLNSGLKPSARSYSQILRALCRSGHHLGCEVFDLLDSMKRNGVVVDSATFKTLLDAFTQSGEFELALRILDVMEELGASLNVHMYNSVLRALVRKEQMSLALSIFFKILEDSSQIPCSIACNELLVGLRKLDMRVEFKRVFYGVREKSGFCMDIWGYNICIHAFGFWGDLSTSLRLFKEMKDTVGPDLCTYNSLIHVLCFVGKVRDALAVYEELKGSGHEPDAFTYRILIQGCCKSYRIDDATKVFNEMQYNGFSPDTVVYNSLLDGLFKARKVSDACQMFEKMVQDGVRASSWTYNILIDGLFKNGRAEAGYAMFCDLRKKGQFVDGVTYSIVILQLCREGLLEEALKFVEEMEGRGFVVDLVTITSLLIGLYKRGRWDWTDRLMKHIRDSNLLPNVLRWKIDMEASMKAPQSKRKDYTPFFPSKGEFSQIMNLIQSVNETMPAELVEDNAKNMSTNADEWSSSSHMDKLADQVLSTDRSSQLFSLSRGRRVQQKGVDSFDIDMVNTFLSIFLAKGNLSLACKLFEIFSDMGVNPVTYTYNSMMTSFVKKGYYDEAWNILDQMGEKLCPADITTYNVIIQGLGKMGRADIASAVLDKLIEQGGYLDVVMYNTLINVLGKAGRIDEVNKLFEQMRATGIDPDVVTYNTLIEVHAKAGRLKDAYKFLRMMLDVGCIPNHVTDTTLDFLGKEIEKQRYQRASIIRNKDDDS